MTTYSKYNNGVSDPAREVFLITPSANILDPVPKAIRADTAGTVTFVAADSTTSVTLNVVAGEILPVRPKLITASTAVIHGFA